MIHQLVLASIAVICSVFILGFLYIELCIPSPIEPEAYTFDPIPQFVGPLEPNNELKTIEKVNPGAYRGPESLAFYNGKIYTGVGDGRIVEIDIATNELRTIVETLGRPPCGGIANERHCGRPLGIRVKDGFIYTVDAYLGLFKINISSGEKFNLLKASEPLPDGYPALFLNDLEVSDDGKIYMTDSSSKYHRENHPYVGFEGSAKGRLIMFDTVTNQTRILLRDLYFANGVQFTPDNKSLLITEMSRCRVIRYYLTGPRAGETEIFSNNLPGLPDNIRPSSRGGYWVAFAVTRHPDLWSTWDRTAPYPWVKRIMAKTLHKFTIASMMPAYGLVLELNGEGQIINSLHDQNGTTLPLTSEVREYEGHLYFGSYFLPFLGKYKLPARS